MLEQLWGVKVIKSWMLVCVKEGCRPHHHSLWSISHLMLHTVRHQHRYMDYYSAFWHHVGCCLLVYAWVPVCWLSRISSERTPVSSGCPQLKGQQTEMRLSDGACVCRVEVPVHPHLWNKRRHPTDPTDKREIISHSKHASIINPNWENTCTFIAAKPCWTKRQLHPVSHTWLSLFIP